MTSRIAVLSLLVAVVGCCYLFPNDIPNPCDGVICGPGAICRPTVDAKSYTCDCPTHCPSYGDHEGSRPLCASDAKDYSEECEMRKAACESNTNITFKYYGKCDPCAGVTCPDPEICQLDKHRSPSCRCAESCPLEFSPICASDGKTYSNECQMHRESCRARKQLKVIFKGQCSSGINPCAEVECRHGAECRVEGGGAVCACPPECEPVLRPVCGSDGRTYDNECELRRAACLMGREIHPQPCSSNGICAGRVCPHGGECAVTNGRGVCRCPRCSNEFAPVCGSDGISYGNRCKLQLESCRHRRDVQVLYDGPCNGCENKKCDFYAVCESDGISEASCVCPKHCEEGTETEEVCGTDNKTYISVCSLRNASCKDKQRILVKHMGSCESCESVTCPPGTWCARGVCSCSNPCAGVPREPVCSNTKTTYIHDCALQRAACESGMRGDKLIKIAYLGECASSHDEDVYRGSNKTVRITELTNDIKAGNGDEENTSESSGAAVCARVQCAYEATCAVDGNGQPRCACLFDCAAATASTSTSSPVCASDLRLYPTLCHMKLEACRRQEDLRLRPLPLCKGLEFRPCGDDEPVIDSEGRPIDCGGGPRRKDCPAGSYCHHTTKVARCCRKDRTTSDKSACQDSWHGCCADGVTAARGAGGAGCAPPCGCHRLGARTERCGEDGTCMCLVGVGGDKCDRCEPGYWGLARAGQTYTGCIPCGCSAFGSVREDCEQMIGRCVCKPGIQGQKCTVCANHEHTLGPNGCFDPESTQLPATSCDNMACYFGAYCRVRSGLATCECNIPDCTNTDDPPVCGSDGRTYLSVCHLRTHACKTQSDIVVQAIKPCDEPQVKREDLNSNDINVEKYETICIANVTSKPYITPIEESSKTNDDYSIYEELNEDKENIYDVPLFDGYSSLTAKINLPSKRFDIRAEVTSVCNEGSLVTVSGTRDYLWLGLTKSNVYLRWDAGSGSSEIRGGRVKTDGRMKISARGYKRDAILKIGTTTSRGASQGRMTSLDVNSLIHVGLPPDNVTNVTNTASLPGFVGCIHRLRVSGYDVIPPSREVSIRITAKGLKPCTPQNLGSVLCP